MPSCRPLQRAIAAAVLAAFAATSAGAAAAARVGEPTAAAREQQWTAPQAAELRRVFEGAPRHGLNARVYLELTEAASDAVLTRTALAYARALASGLVDPGELHGIYTLPRNHVDVASGLAVALRGGQLTAWFAALPPQDAEYAALSRAYVRALARIPEAVATEIPDGPALRRGDVDPRLPAIVARLTSRGLLPDGTTAESYDEATEGAIRRLQRQAGMREDGIIGPDTLAELNVGPRDRARQLAVNLERRRWLARRPPATRIEVNIAAMRLTYWRDGEAAWSARVVAGAPGNETPMLGESFSHLVVNPPWYVPRSIATRELLPRGAAYLRSRRMSYENGRLVQRPGPDSALGLVKFDMRNPYAIYLHDTPAKALFDASDRLRSHGCVRVEDAVAFARRLAEERGRADGFERALASGETQVVELGEAIPVRLLYFTAVVGADGAVSFRHDAYGWDERLAGRLGLEPGRLRARVPLPPDLHGP